jgi:hypothetical protein
VNTLRIVLASLLLLIAAFLLVMNWAAPIASWRNRRNGIDKHVSGVPFTSLVVSAVAYIVYPMQPKGWICLIPALDLPTWMTMVALIGNALGRRKV